MCLIDLGLSPRRTFNLLNELGIRPDQIDDVLLTHFDSDHLHRGWLKPGRRSFPAQTRVRIHRNHARRAEYFGLLTAAETAREQHDGFGHCYDRAFEIHPGVRVDPIVMAHDQQGVVAFRFDFEFVGIRDCDGDAGARSGAREAGSAQAAYVAPSASGSLGYATDLGRVTPSLIEHLRGVNVLAIESNYCPQRQEWSGRPDALKRRIMGGSGHLSNHETLAAVAQISPVEHVVLLHLSRECNCPNLVRTMHEGSDYALTISAQMERTRWIRVAPSMCPVRMKRTLRVGAAMRRGETQMAEPGLWPEPKPVVEAGALDSAGQSAGPSLGPGLCLDQSLDLDENLSVGTSAVAGVSPLQCRGER